MSDEEVAKVQRLAQKCLGVRFRNPEYLLAAISHPSYRNETACPPLEDFDRMEFFGDSILNYAVCRRLYAKFEDANEGLLSRLRSILVSRKILLRVAKSIGLAKFIRLGKSLKDQPDVGKSKLITDCFEAIIAAVYFDQGFDRAEKFILSHMKSYFDQKKLFRLDPNPKSTLQELTLKYWKKLPIYTQKVAPEGIKIALSLNSRLKTTAVAFTRREAEEKAARQLIRLVRSSLSSRSQNLSRVSKTKFSGTKLRKTR